MVLRLALLLCFSLLAGITSAQPAATPVVIDSQQECKAMSGAWVAQGAAGWQFACQTSWGRDECLRLGGAWSPMFGAPVGGLCLAQVSQAATAKQCTQSGGAWGPAGSAMPFCTQGVTRTTAAVRKAPDAGKLCDSQTDCTYGCVYEGPPKPDGADVMGKCRATNAQSGCYAMVEKGRIAGNICVK